MSLGDFENISLLGDGAYSTVYKVKRKSDGQIYALKKVKIGGLSDKEKENALNEVRILASIKNPWVICYKESFIDTDSQSLWLVIEFADDGDLFQKISRSNNGFEEAFIWKVFIQITKGLKALHELSIMHRDLKSANVFLNKDGTAKLGDMNVSKLTDMKGLNYTQTGTPYYASPEVWKDQPYSIKSDIWSLGWVLYEMITFKPPFRASNMEGLFKKVSKGLYQPIPKKYSVELSTLIRALLKGNPDKRPTCEEILQTPSVRKKAILYFPDQEEELDNNELLKTIVFPKNLMYLTDQLPKPSYEDDEIDEGFEEHIKWSTLPHKPNKKYSENFSRVLSRSKLSTQGKRSEQATSEYTNMENKSRSSHSKGSKNISQAQQIMKNNLNYQEMIKKHNVKNHKILDVVWLLITFRTNWSARIWAWTSIRIKLGFTIWATIELPRWLARQN
jgi:serine/threonine protein kinase